MKTYMKKPLFIAVLTVMFIPSLALAAFDTNLQYGSRSLKVVELQEFLTVQGVYSGPITGNFFSLTREGVKAFQTREGISPVAGFFGPITRARANELIVVANVAEQNQIVIETGTTTPTPVFGSTEPVIEVQPVVSSAPPQTEATPISAPVVLPVKKEVRIVPDIHLDKLKEGVRYGIYVYYLENDKYISGLPVTISVDDDGRFNSDNRYSTTTVTTTIGEKFASVVYWPSKTGKRTITATVNGVTATVQGEGNSENAIGWKLD